MKDFLIILAIGVFSAVGLVGALVIDEQIAQGNNQAKIVKAFMFPL